MISSNISLDLKRFSIEVEAKMLLRTFGFHREELRLLLTETLAPKLQLKPCSGSHGPLRSPTKEVSAVTGSDLITFQLESDEKPVFVSIQGKCSPTQRTPPACWGCGAGPWSFSPSLSSERRLTLSKNFSHIDDLRLRIEENAQISAMFLLRFCH